MIEGRSGGSGRGTRRELWAPPGSGSAQPADRRLYRVPTPDPSRSLRRPRISFPPPLPPPSPLPAGHGKNSVAPKRTSPAALVPPTEPDASRPPRPPRISLRPPPLRHRLHLHPGRRLKSSDRTHRTSALHPSP